MSEGEAISRLNQWGGQPLPVSASFWHEGQLWLRLSGARAAVEAARGKLGGKVVVDPEKHWISVREQTHPAFAGPILYAHEGQALFEKPEVFNIERQPNRHLAFGTGPHQCLGLLLARMEMRIFFQQMIPRIEEIALVEPPERIRASFVHGIKHLRIRYRLRPGS